MTCTCNNKGVLVLTVQISTRCTAEFASLVSLHAHATLSISDSYCHIQQDCFSSMKFEQKSTSLQIHFYCTLTVYLLLPQAFTWNGFEDGTTFMGGLWSGRNTQQGDFATVVYRAQLAGFNAIRIPFRCA